MSNLLTQIKKQRFVAMKEKDTDTKLALESVLNAVDNLKGSGPVEIDDAKVIQLVKKEIKAYTDSMEKTNGQLDTTAKIKVLESLLPKQLTNDEVVEILNITGILKVSNNPKRVMQTLDENGYAGQYDKGFVAKLALGK